MLRTDNKINIVIVIPTLKGAGAERVMLTLATHLRHQGIKVSIVVFNDVIELESDFDDVYHFHQYYRWIPRKIRGFCLAFLLDRFIARNCGIPDLILSNLLIADRVVAHSRYNKHIVIHNTISSEIMHLDATLSEYKSLYEGQSLVCVSKGVMTDLSEVLTNQPLERLRYIYNPVDKAFIENAANAVSEFLPNGDYIVHVGSFSPSKRHDLLIQAYVESGIKVPLLLVGKGKLENELRLLVAKLGVEDRVIFCGFQSNPYPFIKNAKLMVLSSVYEGLPTVILEAISLGVPVVSTDCKSGPSEMLPAKNLCAVGDVTGLMVLMRQAISSSQSYVVSLAEEFTPEFACQQYLKLIKTRGSL